MDESSVLMMLDLRSACFCRSYSKEKSGGSHLHPIALSRARNQYILAPEDFLLSIVRKSVIELANDNFSQKTWSGVATRNWWTGLFSSDDVLLFALGARASFLAMLKNLQAGADHLKLMRDQIADEDSIDDAVRTDRFFRFDRMGNQLVRQMSGVVEDMFNAGRFFFFGCSARESSRSRVVRFSLLAVVALVSLLRLSDQNVDFRLQIFQQFAQIFIAVERLLQLSLQILNQLCEVLYLFTILCALLSEALELFEVFVRHINTAIGGNTYMIPPVVSHSRRSERTYDATAYGVSIIRQLATSV